MPKKTSEPKPTTGAPKPKRDKEKRADAAELARRVDEVLAVRIDGAQYHDLVQFAAEKGWGVKERQLREYMARADQLLVERLDKDRDRLFARHVAQRQALYARAVNGADYRTALAVLQDEARLRGLYPAERKQIEVTLPLPDVSQKTPDELDRIIAAVGPLFAGTLLHVGAPDPRPHPLLLAVGPDVPA